MTETASEVTAGIAGNKTATEVAIDTVPKSELELAQQELQREKAGRAAENQTYNLHRTQYQDQLRSLQGNENQQYEQGQPQQPQDNDLVRAQQNKEQEEATREQLGRLTYRSNNPDWNDYQTEVDALINDPAKAPDIAVNDRFGNIDYARSYQNAKTQIELVKLRAAQAATEDAKQGQKTEQDRQKGQATISGSSASEVDEGVDVGPMTSDEMIEAGLVDMDPRDPVHKLRPDDG